MPSTVKGVRRERSSEGLTTHRKRVRTVPVPAPVPMPSVEMRRTTRVFGARVLRSGRRLFTTQEVCKHMKRAPLAAANAEEDWIGLLGHGCGGGGGDVKFKENGWLNSNEGNKGAEDEMLIDEGEPDKETKLGQLRNISSIELVDHDGHSLMETRRWGLVYSRKRMRSESISCSSSDKRFGKKFSRNQPRKKIVTEDVDDSPSMLPPNITTTTPTTTTTKSRSSSKSKSKKKKVKKVLVSKPTCSNLPNLPSRNGVSINGGIQKRRSSLSSRKLINSPSIGNLKSTGGLVQDGLQFFPIKSVPVITRPIQKASFKEHKELTQDIDSASCNASILVIESDRCYREVGAVISMEMVGPKQWFLIVRRNGVERFRVDALNLMRPCFCNRVTHAIIWAAGDEGWKLEFPNRQDWSIFKELYRKCSERTVPVQSSLASIIPVPRVSDVSDYADEKYVPFKMPELYISSRGDEVSRMLEKSGPIYDMDSDDDEWLNKFNDGRNVRVDEDSFEKIIDAFERGIYCSPEDYSDATMAVDRCLVLASKDILEAVYDHWIAKRKKHSALVRVFQFYKPKRPDQLTFKSILRKKRSFRKRGTQTGRGKQLTFLKAALYEESDTEIVVTEEEAEDTATKVEETQVAAEWAEEVAAMKRQRAQLLMKIADLLTYKAAMAVKIAEFRATPDNAFDELL